MRLFAQLKADHGGWQVIEVPDTARVSDVRAALEKRGIWVSGSRIAVNHSFADENDTVGMADEVAVIPPVSGG